MIARWRSLTPLAQDILSALAFAFVWFTMFDFWTARGWYPAQPQTFQIAGWWAAGALTLRRTWPRTILVATAIGYPLFYGDPSYGLQTEFHLLPILIAGYGATLSGRVRPALAALGAVFPILLISLIAHGLMPPASEGRDISELLFHVFAALAVVYLGMLMRRQQETASALAQRNAELEILRAAEAERAVTEERNRIARELHDVVAHHLVALVVRGQATLRVSDHRPELTGESLQWMVTTAREALTSTRQTVKVLRAADQTLELVPQPTLADLDRLVERVGGTGLDITLEVSDLLPPLDDHTQMNTVRIAQEALTNTLKHAQASHVTITLRPHGEGVLLEITDDGLGNLGDYRTVGNGLTGMKERAVSCGGSLEAGEGPGGGWQIRALLPASAT